MTNDTPTTEYIENFSELATDQKRSDALRILDAGYRAIETSRILHSKLKLEGSNLKIADRSYNLDNYRRILVLAVGKCAREAGENLEELLGDRLSDGVILDLESSEHTRVLRSLVGTHPLPSPQNIEAAKQIKQLAEEAGEDDLVITVISGGGSALLCLPSQITIDTLIKVNQLLTKKGADIYELNTVRKHLSEIKGGHLAHLLYPAETISLIFSDVLGDDLSVIASGPTVRDNTTVEDAYQILKKYEVEEELNLSPELLTETPKEEHLFEKITNILTVTNRDALAAMEECAEELGYRCIRDSHLISGEARRVGREFAGKELAPGQAIIGGGETTVTITGNGQGGRNQEAALGALSEITSGKIFISAGSDGQDNSDAAGALADRELYDRAEQAGLDISSYLENNDSYNFFRQAGGQIYTGATGSNVSDLYLLLANN